MNDQIFLARELLRQLLAAAPQKGSRLKVLLAREFERRAGASFQEAFWNFPKFSAFLAANADLLDVIAPDGPGDITVQLRQDVLSRPPSLLPESSSFVRFLPPSVWSAFTNPDSRRRRFFNRVTGDVAHYIENSQEAPNPTVAATVASDSNYIEILPVSAEQQSAWLKEFLASVRLPESKQVLLGTLAETPYSSAVNTAVAATLGDLGESWRQFRAAKVHEAVRSWAERRGVPLDQVLGLAASKGHMTTEQHTRHEFAATAPREASSVHELRRWLHTLIDSLDPADVSQILLPASALFKLTGGRG